MIMKKTILLLVVFFCAFDSFAQQDTTLVSNRPDGRLQSTYAILHQMLRDTEPACAFKAGMTKKQYGKWQKKLKEGMKAVMKWPEVKNQPQPALVSTEQKEGYWIEHWECYPLEKAVAPFIVMIPDGCTAKTPAIMCIPGSGGTMEALTEGKGMGITYVKEGWIAVCVDNACAGEQADQENKYPDSWDYDYDLSSRILLELGWSWLGYTSFVDYQILQWMKTQPLIDKSRIVVSGFSLGTEPMMVIGVMDKDIYAFVYNDFLCQTQERALSMTAINEKGRRIFPNSIRHLIPDYWREFNFPDVCCALAPRHLIFTEGGLDRDFRLVQEAYQSAGAPDAVECHHQKRFAEPSSRVDYQSLPEGLTRSEYFEMVNVDTKAHYFKRDLILPWLRKILK